MSAFRSMFVLSALVVIFHVQGAMMGDQQSSDNGRAGLSIQEHKAEEDSKELGSQAPVASSLKSIADAAHAVSSNAASNGIDAAGCGSSPATMLKAVAAKAKQMAAAKVPCVKEEEEAPETKPEPCKQEISPERKNAQEAGKEALSLAEASAKACDEANVATAKSEAAKKKVDVMKNIVSKAYEDAATEAADVAKAKISHVAALETIQAPPAKKSKVAELEKKEKAALKELNDIPTAKGCDCSAKELNEINDEEKQIENQIEANLAQAVPGLPR